VRKYPLITHALRTCFNAEDGLSLDVAIRLYVGLAVGKGMVGEYLSEVDAAMSDPATDWKAMLLNDDYEVYYAETADEAKQYARQILHEPLQQFRSKRG